MYRFLVFMVLTACTVTPTDTTMPRDTACHEQADAWCTRAGFGDAPGCTVWYVHVCEPGGPDGTIELAAQDACLDAIAANPSPGVNPPACVATW